VILSRIRCGHADFVAKLTTALSVARTAAKDPGQADWPASQALTPISAEADQSVVTSDANLPR
jgi:hypothetical protein